MMSETGLDIFFFSKSNLIYACVTTKTSLYKFLERAVYWL